MDVWSNFWSLPLDSWNHLTGTISATVTVILGTLGYLATRRATKKSTESQVRVNISFGFRTYGVDVDEEQQVILQGVNSGVRRVVLASAGLNLPGGHQLVWTHPEAERPLPCEVSESQRCLLWMPLEAVKEAVRRAGFSGAVDVVGYFQDTLGTEHRSKPKKFNV
jgi:hypothetical protein